MRPLTPRAFVLPWLVMIAVIVSFSAVSVRADDAHDEAGHAADEAHEHTDEAAAHEGDGHSQDGGEHGAEGHDDAHGDAAHDGHGGVDYNEVPMFFDPKLFFWSLAVFLLFLFLARQFAWSPLIKGLDARESRVNRALHDAEAARVEAERLLSGYDAKMDQVQEEVKAIVAAARQEAEAEKAKIIAEADVEATDMRDKAIAEIEAAHQQALSDLDSQIGRQVAMATEHVLGQTS